MPLPLPAARCALTAPFHPYLPKPRKRECRTGGLLSVALSLGLPPPGVTRLRIPVEPGLSSTPSANGGVAVIRPPDVFEINPV